MVQTKTANGQDQDRLGQDQDLKKSVLRPVLLYCRVQLHHGNIVTAIVRLLEIAGEKR